MCIRIDQFQERFDELIEVFRCQTSGIDEFIELRVIEKICQIIRDTLEKSNRFNIRSEDKQLGGKILYCLEKM